MAGKTIMIGSLDTHFKLYYFFIIFYYYLCHFKWHKSSKTSKYVAQNKKKINLFTYCYIKLYETQNTLIHQSVCIAQLFILSNICWVLQISTKAINTRASKIMFHISLPAKMWTCFTASWLPRSALFIG